jgi:hypothetical protein
MYRSNDLLASTCLSLKPNILTFLFVFPGAREANLVCQAKGILSGSSNYLLFYKTALLNIIMWMNITIKHHHVDEYHSGQGQGLNLCLIGVIVYLDEMVFI